MRILPVCVGLGATVLASAAAAQVNQSYAYDANGRLVGVTTSGSAGSNAASYAYDDANNRTLRGQSGVSSWAALRRLPVDGLLSPHQALTSPDGTWSLALRSSGRLELWSADAPVPSELASVFEVSAEGEARFLPPAGMASGEARVELASDGRLLMLNGRGEVLWRSNPATAEEGGQ